MYKIPGMEVGLKPSYLPCMKMRSPSSRKMASMRGSGTGKPSSGVISIHRLSARS